MFPRRGQGMACQAFYQLPHRSRACDFLAGDDGVAGGDSVSEANLHRVAADGGCQFVHLGFVGEARLHCAEASHGAARQVVGAHADTFKVTAGGFVGAVGEASGVGEHGTGGGSIGAAV